MKTIRRLTKEDLRAFREMRQLSLLTDSGTLITSPEEEKVKRDDELITTLESAHVLGLFSQDSMIGMGTLARHSEMRRSHVAEVFWVFVLPEHRGVGLAKSLMSEIEKQATLLGIECLELHVVANNDAAISLYQGLGYVEYGKLPKAVKHDGQYTDGIFMLKFI